MEKRKKYILTLLDENGKEIEGVSVALYDKYRDYSFDFVFKRCADRVLARLKYMIEKGWMK